MSKYFQIKATIGVMLDEKSRFPTVEGSYVIEQKTTVELKGPGLVHQRTAIVDYQDRKDNKLLIVALP